MTETQMKAGEPPDPRITKSTGMKLINKKEGTLRGVLKKHKEIVRKNQPDALQKVLGPMKKSVTKLETKIYRVKLNIHEMRHVQKKYLAIRQSLLDDSVHFNSTLDRLEQQLAKQQGEIEHLQLVKSDAMGRRDLTKGSLAKLEQAVLVATAERALHIQQLRRMVEDRKNQLERVERSLLPSGEQEEYRESAKAPAQHFECPEKDIMEQKFEKLKAISGAKNPEEVLVKFQSQRDTKQRLTELKMTTEKDKKELEDKKLSMEAELESHKFAQVKEKERSEEEIEQIQEEIAAKLIEKQTNEQDVDGLKNKLLFIRDLLHDLSMELMEIESSPLPDIEPESVNMDKLIEVIKVKLIALMELKEEKLLQIERRKDEKLDSSGIMEVLLEVKRGKKIVREGASDVPTRAYLKRQSQLYVEAMTRRKGFQQKVASLERK